MRQTAQRVRNRRLHILAVLWDYQCRRAPVPSIRELACLFAASTSTIFGDLRALAAMGYIARPAHGRRAIRVIVGAIERGEAGHGR